MGFDKHEQRLGDKVSYIFRASHLHTVLLLGLGLALVLVLVLAPVVLRTSIYLRLHRALYQYNGIKLQYHHVLHHLAIEQSSIDILL